MDQNVNVLFIGEVRQSGDWIPMDWGFTSFDVEQKVRRRIRRLLGPITHRVEADAWEGRVAKFVRDEGMVTTFIPKSYKEKEK